MKSHANRVGWREACNTHFFHNAVPQQALLNQGDWLDLESYSRAAANKYGSVWVITGPIFDPDQSLETIGDANEVPVVIPNALFKILVKESDAGGPPPQLCSL